MSRSSHPARSPGRRVASTLHGRQTRSRAVRQRRPVRSPRCPAVLGRMFTRRRCPRRREGRRGRVISYGSGSDGTPALPTSSAAHHNPPRPLHDRRHHARRDSSGPEVGRAFDIAVPLGREPLMRARELLDAPLNLVAEHHGAIAARAVRIEQGTARLRGVQPKIRLATTPERWKPENQAQCLSNPCHLSQPTGHSGLRTRYQKPLRDNPLSSASCC